MYLQDSVNVRLQVINATHPLMYSPVRHQPVLQLDPPLLHHLRHQHQMLNHSRRNSHRAVTELVPLRCLRFGWKTEADQGGMNLQPLLGRDSTDPDNNIGSCTARDNVRLPETPNPEQPWSWRWEFCSSSCRCISCCKTTKQGNPDFFLHKAMPKLAVAEVFNHRTLKCETSG